MDRAIFLPPKCVYRPPCQDGVSRSFSANFSAARQKKKKGQGIAPRIEDAIKFPTQGQETTRPKTLGHA